MNAVPVETRTVRRRGYRALGAALAAALQWRLLLLWLLLTLLPTLLATLPLWTALQSQFGHSVHAGDIAAGRNLALLFQGLGNLGEHAFGPVSAGMLAATALMLLSPFLSGMVIASLRSGQRLGFGALVAGGCREYWRMLRMLLWSILPLGAALVCTGVAMGVATKASEGAILASDVERTWRWALGAAAVAFVVLHASVEAGRGWLGADAGLRSVVHAWWRGLLLLLRRPLATLGVYLGATLLGLLAALLFAWLRLRVDGASAGAFAAGFLLAQAAAAALAWGRIARLYGLADLAADAAARTRAAAAPPAGAPAETALSPSPPST